MWTATSSRLCRTFLILGTLAAAGCGGGGGGSTAPLPIVTAAATSTPAPSAPGAAPTAPASAGPSSATTQATYTSANTTITLPTVGMIASQITLPPNLVPDGTQLSISVSSGGSTASSAARGGKAHRSAIDAFAAWSATITSPVNVALDTSQMSVTLAAGSGVSTGGAMTYYAGNGTTFTDLGSVGADSSNAAQLIFDGASPCATGEGNTTNTTSGTTFTDSWDLAQQKATVRVRPAQTSGTCAASTASSAPPLATGAFYVSDPGASAVFLFPSGANGNVQPYSPLAAAPVIATDFAGELISGAVFKPLKREDAEIREYGSSSIVDQLVTTNLGDLDLANVNFGVGADPLGAHIGLVGQDVVSSSCKSPSGASKGNTAVCPPAIDLFDRTQSGIAAPAVGADLDAQIWGIGLWLDQNDNAFFDGAVQVGTDAYNGAVEYALNFGSQGYTNGPFAVFPMGVISQITTDAAGNVYVANPNNGVYVFSPGTTVPGWTLPSSVLPNTSGGPTGVGVDAQGNVYVSSPQLWNYDGTTLLAPAAILVFPPIASWSGASTTPIRTIAGSATGLVSPGKIAIINASPSSPPTSSITLTPTTVSFTAATQSQSVSASERGYSGTFAESDTCGGIATIAAASGGFSITAAAAGTCYATISDTNGNSAKLGITVTTTGFTVSSRSRT